MRSDNSFLAQERCASCATKVDHSARADGVSGSEPHNEASARLHRRQRTWNAASGSSLVHFCKARRRARQRWPSGLRGALLGLLLAVARLAVAQTGAVKLDRVRPQVRQAHAAALRVRPQLSGPTLAVGRVLQGAQQQRLEAAEHTAVRVHPAASPPRRVRRLAAGCRLAAARLRECRQVRGPGKPSVVCWPDHVVAGQHDCNRAGAARSRLGDGSGLLQAQHART